MIVLDPQKRRMCHEVTLDCCELSPHQWSMAELFQKNSGRVTLYQEIIEYVYPDVKQYDGITPTAISSIAYRLRRKLAQISPKKEHIISRPGFGYRYEPNGEDAA